jgi:hypothetical protein
MRFVAFYLFSVAFSTEFMLRAGTTTTPVTTTAQINYYYRREQLHTTYPTTTPVCFGQDCSTRPLLVGSTTFPPVTGNCGHNCGLIVAPANATEIPYSISANASTETVMSTVGPRTTLTGVGCCGGH